MEEKYGFVYIWYDIKHKRYILDVIGEQKMMVIFAVRIG